MTTQQEQVKTDVFLDCLKRLSDLDPEDRESAIRAIAVFYDVWLLPEAAERAFRR